LELLNKELIPHYYANRYLFGCHIAYNTLLNGLSGQNICLHARRNIAEKSRRLKKLNEAY
jgi:hypothetical protein